MSSYNKVIMMGNLTRDPEIRSTPSGQSVVNFGLATNRVFKTKAGEKREETCFVDCELWGPKAEAFNKYLSKGRSVHVEGRLKFDSWEDNDGNKRSKHVIHVDEFTFVNDGKGNGGGADGGSKQAVGAGASAVNSNNLDDIPF